MMTHSTEEAAKKAGIHPVTLWRWLSQKRVRPSIAVPMKGQTLWRWTAADISKLKEYKASHYGRWPKRGEQR